MSDPSKPYINAVERSKLALHFVALDRSERVMHQRIWKMKSFHGLEPTSWQSRSDLKAYLGALAVMGKQKGGGRVFSKEKNSYFDHDEHQQHQRQQQVKNSIKYRRYQQQHQQQQQSKESLSKHHSDHSQRRGRNGGLSSSSSPHQFLVSIDEGYTSRRREEEESDSDDEDDDGEHQSSNDEGAGNTSNPSHNPNRSHHAISFVMSRIAQQHRRKERKEQKKQNKIRLRRSYEESQRLSLTSSQQMPLNDNENNEEEHKEEEGKEQVIHSQRPSLVNNTVPTPPQSSSPLQNGHRKIHSPSLSPSSLSPPSSSRPLTSNDNQQIPSRSHSLIQTHSRPSTAPLRPPSSSSASRLDHYLLDHELNIKATAVINDIHNTHSEEMKRLQYIGGKTLVKKKMVEEDKSNLFAGMKDKYHHTFYALQGIDEEHKDGESHSQQKNEITEIKTLKGGNITQRNQHLLNNESNMTARMNTSRTPLSSTRPSTAPATKSKPYGGMGETPGFRPATSASTLRSQFHTDRQTTPSNTLPPSFIYPPTIETFLHLAPIIKLPRDGHDDHGISQSQTGYTSTSSSSLSSARPSFVSSSASSTNSSSPLIVNGNLSLLSSPSCLSPTSISSSRLSSAPSSSSSSSQDHHQQREAPPFPHQPSFITERPLSSTRSSRPMSVYQQQKHHHMKAHFLHFLQATEPQLWQTKPASSSTLIPAMDFDDHEADRDRDKLRLKRGSFLIRRLSLTSARSNREEGDEEGNGNTGRPETQENDNTHRGH